LRADCARFAGLSVHGHEVIPDTMAGEAAGAVEEIHA
jgi:hypothetical protein